MSIVILSSLYILFVIITFCLLYRLKAGLNDSIMDSSIIAVLGSVLLSVIPILNLVISVVLIIILTIEPDEFNVTTPTVREVVNRCKFWKSREDE